MHAPSQQVDETSQESGEKQKQSAISRRLDIFAAANSIHARLINDESATVSSGKKKEDGHLSSLLRARLINH
jgi:hypothetical protein